MSVFSKISNLTLQKHSREATYDSFSQKSLIVSTISSGRVTQWRDRNIPLRGPQTPQNSWLNLSWKTEVTKRNMICNCNLFVTWHPQRHWTPNSAMKMTGYAMLQNTMGGTTSEAHINLLVPWWIQMEGLSHFEVSHVFVAGYPPFFGLA